LNLYLDASALVKRYVAEPGSELVRDAMADADAWFMCRIGFVETYRALGIAAGERVAQRFATEWPAFGSIEVEAGLAEAAAGLAVPSRLRTLDALHLAAALALPRDQLLFAAWDERLRDAAAERGLPLLPESLT
jgi:predicted nucleic acid-binding protein